MKEEILRRQDIFKAFLEKELVSEYDQEYLDAVNNIMTLYKADNQALINLIKNEILIIVNQESAIDGQYLEPSQTRKEERKRITEALTSPPPVARRI